MKRKKVEAKVLKVIEDMLHNQDHLHAHVKVHCRMLSKMAEAHTLAMGRIIALEDRIKVLDELNKTRKH
jgi:hypothetical protein